MLDNTPIVMSMYNLIEYSDNYLKTFGNLWKYYRDEPSLNNVGADFAFTGVIDNSHDTGAYI